jgi:hypothetical protein
VKRWMLAAAMLLLLACSARTRTWPEMIKDAQGDVGKQLREPASAQFSDMVVRQGPAGSYVCGKVDSKDGVGNMSGPQPFAVVAGQAYLAGERPPAAIWPATGPGPCG